MSDNTTALLSKDLPVQHTGTQYRLNILVDLQKEIGLKEGTHVVLRVFKSQKCRRILVSHIDDTRILMQGKDKVPILAYGVTKIHKGMSMALPFNIRYAAKGITRWSIFQADVFESEKGFKYMILTLKDETTTATRCAEKDLHKEYRLTPYFQAKQRKAPSKRKKKAKQPNHHKFSLSKSYNLFVPEKTRQLLGWPTGEWKLIRLITDKKLKTHKILVEAYSENYDYYDPKPTEVEAIGCCRKLRVNRLLNLPSALKAAAKKYNLTRCVIRTRNKLKYLLIS